MSRRPQIRATLGPCDDMRAEVFVSLDDGPEAAELVGTVTGPRRGRDATLPTTARLVPLPAASNRAAVSRAILTEPAFWTPELPNLYRVEATLRPAPAAGDPLGSWIGLRRLGVRGRSFWLDGRRWVPRAVRAGLSPVEAREAAVGIVVVMPTDEILATTDEAGVAVVAVLDRGHASPACLASLAGHPSAMLAILPEPMEQGSVAALRRAAGTLQLGIAADGTRPPPAPPPAGVDFLVVTLPEDRVPHDGWRVCRSVPLVAWRGGGAAGRPACDLLQRDLARWGSGAAEGGPAWDWAGYLVGGDSLRDTLHA